MRRVSPGQASGRTTTSGCWKWNSVSDGTMLMPSPARTMPITVTRPASRYDMGYWFAAYVPAHTPPEVIERLHGLLVAGVKSPAAKSVYESSGTEPVTSTPDALAKFQQVETQKWGKVTKAAGIEPE